MPLKIEDELGYEWIVKKGDPAYEAISALRKGWFQLITLPQEVLLGVGAGVQVERPGTLNVIRMNDCIEFLKRLGDTRDEKDSGTARGQKPKRVSTGAKMGERVSADRMEGSDLPSADGSIVGWSVEAS